MGNEVYATPVYQDCAKRVKEKEAELIRLLQTKAEKHCNNFLTNKYHTQLSYLTKEEQLGAVAVPKEIMLDKMLSYLRSL